MASRYFLQNNTVGSVISKNLIHILLKIHSPNISHHKLPNIIDNCCYKFTDSVDRQVKIFNRR